MARLPAFLTQISPVGETLAAAEQGVTLLEEDVALRNAQLVVSTAEEGLSLWEADYSLERSGNTAARRARIRTAMAGGQTLTRQQLEALAVTVSGADRGEVEENYENWRVTLFALYDEGMPAVSAALEEAVHRLAPAHLEVEVIPALGVQAAENRYLALTGGCFLQLTSIEGT